MELADPPHHLHLQEPLVPTGSMISKEENGSVGGRRGEIHSSAAGAKQPTMITSTSQVQSSSGQFEELLVPTE